MIILTEISPPIKLPGLNSIKVEFNYKQEIVDTIKQVPNAIYHKKQQCWEIPTTSLARCIELLANYDDIDLHVNKDISSDINTEVQLNTQKYKTLPYEYQLEGIKYGLNHDKWLLLDQPGLGKSLQLIYLAQELKEREHIEHCLVICGINTLKTNWKNEIKSHSDLSCRILGERINSKGITTIGSIQDRLDDLKHPIDEFFVITNIETLRNDDIIKEINKNKHNKFDMIVVDEIHKCFDYKTTISTNKGPIKIGDIVSQKLDVLVKSYNTDTNNIEYQPIINHFENVIAEPFIELEIETKEGMKTIQCTANHKFFTTNRGWVCAKDLTSDDDLFDNL